MPSPHSCFSMDSSLLSNIQKLFYEKIEVFSAVEFSKLSITTGIVKIFLKVRMQSRTARFSLEPILPLPLLPACRHFWSVCV